jgi:CheY-like chemotaxis protein
LLEQLLTWARSQRGDLEFQPQVLDLTRAVYKTAHLFSAQANAKEIAIVQTNTEPHWVYADRAMLQTILRNLFSNAIKFTPTQGAITIVIDNSTHHTRLQINDNGIGMDAQQQQRLFRLDMKPRSVPGTYNEGGSGLGLILCSEFVERNGGTIGVNSEPGEGSSFWITLPSSLPPDDDKNAAPAIAHDTRNILLVDDRQISRESGALILNEMHHQVTFAHDGEEAVQHASEQHFDLILMDIDMPRMNGIEATRHIRATGNSSHIVALSSYLRTEIEMLDSAVKFDGYLEKPLSREALLAELTRLFSNAN